MLCNYLWKDVGDSWDKDVGAADAFLHQAPQGLPALQTRSAVHHDHTEFPALLKRLTEDVVDQWRAEQKGIEIEMKMRRGNVRREHGKKEEEGRWEFKGRDKKKGKESEWFKNRILGLDT